MERNSRRLNGRTHLAVDQPDRLLGRERVADHSAILKEVILRSHRLVPVDELPAPHARPDTSLTRRELQIVSLVADGRINKQIAAELHISEWTVSTHLRRVFVKLGVDTRAAMVAKCAQAMFSAVAGR